MTAPIAALAAVADTIHRQVQQLLQFAIVDEVDYVRGLVRLRIGNPEVSGEGLVTGWRPWLLVASHDASSVMWDAPQRGERVLIACPSGELRNAVVVGRMLSVVAMPPGAEEARRVTTMRQWGDGALMQYDRGRRGELRWESRDGTTIRHSVEEDVLEVRRPDGSHLRVSGADGNVLLKGALRLRVDGDLTISAGGRLRMEGDAASVVARGSVVVLAGNPRVEVFPFHAAPSALRDEVRL